MITKLEIQNFRGLKHVTFEHLKRVNLLVGGNDTGKTSVLEAMTFLLGDGAALVNLPAAFRGHPQDAQSAKFNIDDFENFWLWLFNDRDLKNQINVLASAEDGSEVRLYCEPRQSSMPATGLIRSFGAGKTERHILIPQNGPIAIPRLTSLPGLRISRLAVRPSNPIKDAERYNQVALKAGGEKRIEQVMREINPDVARLRYAKLPGTTSPLVFVDIGLSRAIPAPQMGQAFNRLLHIYTEILSANTNVLLVDEIENGIFTSNLLPIWKGLFAICDQENVQVFATTHSLECVRAALGAAQERNKDELGVQRMQVVDGKLEAVALSGETLTYALENNLEIRK